MSRMCRSVMTGSSSLMSLLVLLFFCLIMGQTLADPCESEHHRVVDDYRRETSYVPPARGNFVCDAYMESGWYRFMVNGTQASIPTSCVEPNRCGTQAPVWVNMPETHIPSPGAEVVVQACSSWSSSGQETNCCFYPYSVTVRNCGEFFVYRLSSTQACNIAYCVETDIIDCGEGWLFDTVLRRCVAILTPSHPCTQGEEFDETTKSCVARQKTLGRPQVTIFVDDLGGAFLNCSWTSSTHTHVVGPIVTWYLVAGGSFKPVSDRQTLKVGSDVFAGSTVVCGFESNADSLAGQKDTTGYSEPFFLGLKVREHNVTVRDNAQPVNVTIYSTIPIYCASATSTSSCMLGVSLLAFGQDGEPNPRVRFSTCYVEFKASDCLGAVCSEHVVQVTYYPDIRHTAQEEVITLVGAISGQGLWRQEVVDVEIHLQHVPIAQCHVFTDPHIITFDGEVHQFHSRGTFLLHESLTRDFTVHVRVSECRGGGGSCACGLVARDTDDVVSIDMCHGQLPPGKADVSFPGSFLTDDVKVFETNNGNMLTVLFSSGTLIKAVLEVWGMSISLLAPPTDDGLSRGLCGMTVYDPDNDLIDPVGGRSEGVSSGQNVGDLVEIWRLPPGRSFFDEPPLSTSVMHGTAPRCDCSPSETPGGTCPHTRLLNDVVPSVLPADDRTDFFFTLNRFQGGSGDEDLPATLASDSTVGHFERRGLELPVLGNNIVNGRTLYGSLQNEPPTGEEYALRRMPEYYFKYDSVKEASISTSTLPPHSALSENEAADICTETLLGSDVALNCAEHLGKSIETVFEICKSDMKVKGERSWVEAAMSLLVTLCDLSLLQSARHFSKTSRSKPEWPAVLQNALACPRGCGGGNCIAGGCQCAPGFSGRDCRDFREQMPLNGEKASTASINATLPSSDTTSYSTSSTTFTTTATVTAEDTRLFIATQDSTTILFDTTNSTTVTDSSPAESTTSTLHTASFTVTEMFTSEHTPKTTPSWTVDDVSSTSTWPATTTTEQSDSTTTAEQSDSTTTTEQSDSTTTTEQSDSTTTTEQSDSTTTTEQSDSTTTTEQSDSTTTTEQSDSTPTEYLTSSARTAPTTGGPPIPMSGHGQSTEDVITTAKAIITTKEDVGPSTDSHSLDKDDHRFLLCEVNTDRCTDVVFDIFSGYERLRCRVFPVAVADGQVKALLMSQPLITGSTFGADGRFTCILPYVDFLRPAFSSRVSFDSLQVEVVALPGDVLSTVVYTVYDSLCRSCGKDGRSGCTTIPDTCYIQGKCYRSRQPQPFSSCFQCRPDISQDDWSTRADNVKPVIRFEDRPVVFLGQSVRVHVWTVDPDGSRLILSVDRKDAYISQAGLFQWRTPTNGVHDVGVHSFVITARDECNGTTSSTLEIVTIPCECDNGGTCTNPAVVESDARHDCLCAPGYTGKRCESDIDECSWDPCLHGTCVDLVNGYRCICNPGYEGERCESVSDQCHNEPCFPGVLCQPAGGSFICGPCPAGYTGDGQICVELDACESSPCFPGVQCKDLAPPSEGFDCDLCPRFFLGDGRRCQRTTESACHAKVCSDHVTCQELKEFPGYRCGPCPRGYRGDGSSCEPICEDGCPAGRLCVRPGLCGCRPGYSGDTCNIPVCSPVCRNGGMCVSPNQCRCVPGYTGAQCLETTCSPPCVNDGRCVGRNRCLCRHGYLGNRCELQACGMACQNDGVCVGPNRCRCQPGFHGQYCQHAACYPPCMNGGICASPGRCQCPAGYDGLQCEQAICNPLCQNGGICKRFNTCKCLPGYEGHRCQSATCLPSCRNGGRCVAPNTCSCSSGWGGNLCDRSVCSLPCRNGGLCFKPEVCACRRGYGGSDCTQALCWPQCQHGGWCRAPNVCHCPRGFYGKHSKSPLDAAVVGCFLLMTMAGAISGLCPLLPETEAEEGNAREEHSAKSGSFITKAKLDS